MTYKQGMELEKRLARLLGLKRTAMSGAKWDDADLKGKHTIIEAKYRSTNGFSADSKHISKLKNQALKLGKDWVYIQENQSGTYALMDLNFFAELWELWNNDS